MKLKKLLVAGLAGVMMLATMTGCGGNSSDEIHVVSREDGSGTRGAFTELLRIAVDDVDNTVSTAEITQITSVMMTTIAGNESAIGYVSLGSLNDEVKAVQVDGVAPSVDTVKDGSYKVSRPFIIAHKDGLSDVAQDYINYILSAEGQAIIGEEGYITIDDAAPSYTASGMSGRVTLAGSTSVAPVMEKLADAYMALNPDVTVEIQQSGSSAGIESAIQGACDIAMSSRELKEEETAEGLDPIVMAMDGIAVIVNKNNDVENLTSEQIMKIYTGEITSWSEVE